MTSKLITTWDKTRVFGTWAEATEVGKLESVKHPMGFAKIECSSGRTAYFVDGAEGQMKFGVVTPKGGTKPNGYQK